MKKTIGFMAVLALSMTMGCSHFRHQCSECEKSEKASMEKKGQGHDCEECKKSEEKSSADAKKNDCGCGHHKKG